MKGPCATLFALTATAYLSGGADVVSAQTTLSQVVSKEVAEAIQQEQQASALAAKGQVAEAEALYKQSLATVERSLPNDPILAGSLNNVAQFYRTQKRFAEAEELLKRALAIYVAAYGDNHIQTARAINNLGNTYLSQGKANLAEPLLVRGLAATEKLVGPDQISVAISLDWLAEAYYFQGRYVEAEARLRRGLAIAEKATPASPPVVWRILNHLISVISSQHRDQEVRALKERADQIIAKWPEARQ